MKPKARILHDNGNWIEGEILQETSSLIVIKDVMYGECRVRKNNGVTIIRNPDKVPFPKKKKVPEFQFTSYPISF